jgi:hypothetical protein
MVGEVIVVRIPLLDAEGMTLVKLHGIEAHGIWIESQDLTNELMAKFHCSSSRTTPIVFIKSVSFIGTGRCLSIACSMSFAQKSPNSPGHQITADTVTNAVRIRHCPAQSGQIDAFPRGVLALALQQVADSLIASLITNEAFEWLIRERRRAMGASSQGSQSNNLHLLCEAETQSSRKTSTSPRSWLLDSRPSS